MSLPWDSSAVEQSHIADSTLFYLIRLPVAKESSWSIVTSELGHYCILFKQTRTWSSCKSVQVIAGVNREAEEIVEI